MKQKTAAPVAAGPPAGTLANLFPRLFVERMIEPLFADPSRANRATSWLGEPLALACAQLCRWALIDTRDLHRRGAVAGLKARRARAKAVDLIDGLARDGVQGIAIDGLGSALGVYPLPAYRMLNDAAILFRQRDLPRLAELLSSRKFRSEPDTECRLAPDGSAAVNFAPIPLADTDCAFAIHRAVAGPPASLGLDVERVFSHAQPVETEWGRCPIPAHEHSFAMIALSCHRRHYGRAALSGVFDACLMLNRFGGGMDWREVETVARRGRFVERLVFFRELLAALGAGRAPLFEDRGLSPWRRAQIDAVVERYQEFPETGPGGARELVLGALQLDSLFDALGFCWRRLRHRSGARVEPLPGLPVMEAPTQPAEETKSRRRPDAAENLPVIRFSRTEVEAREVDQETLRKATAMFRENGALLIENAFAPEFIERLRAAFASRYNAYFRDADFSDALLIGDKRRMLTLELEPPFTTPELYANPLVFPIIRQLIGWRCILLGFGAVVSLPGAEHQHVHRDHPYLYDRSIDHALPPSAVSMLVPLVDLNEISGTTRIWRGSHAMNSDDDTDWEIFEPVAPIGSCLLMDFRTIHGGAANRSDRVRPIIYNVYSRPWFRDHVNYSKQPRLRISEREYRRVPIRDRYLFSWTRIDAPRAPSAMGALVRRLMRRVRPR